MAVWTSVARGATELVVSEGTEMLGVVPAFGEGVGYRGLWVPETVMLLCLSTRELGEVPLVAFGEVAVVVEACGCRKLGRGR